MTYLARASSRWRKAVAATDLVDVLTCIHTIRMTRPQRQATASVASASRRAEGRRSYGCAKSFGRSW